MQLCGALRYAGQHDWAEQVPNVCHCKLRTGAAFGVGCNAEAEQEQEQGDFTSSAVDNDLESDCLVVRGILTEEEPRGKDPGWRHRKIERVHPDPFDGWEMRISGKRRMRWCRRTSTILEMLDTVTLERALV